jgi:hypothetical protein
MGGGKRWRWGDELVDDDDYISPPTPKKYNGIAHSPAFETAATSSGEDIHDIPGRIRGYLHPKREVILVRTAGTAAIIVFVRCDSLLPTSHHP